MIVRKIAQIVRFPRLKVCIRSHALVEYVQ